MILVLFICYSTAYLFFCMRPHVGQDRDHQSWRVENPMQNHEFDAKTFSVVWCWYVVYGMVPVCTTRGSHSHIGMYGTILYYLFLSTYYFIHSHYHWSLITDSLTHSSFLFLFAFIIIIIFYVTPLVSEASMTNHEMHHHPIVLPLCLAVHLVACASSSSSSSSSVWRWLLCHSRVKRWFQVSDHYIISTWKIRPSRTKISDQAIRRRQQFRNRWCCGWNSIINNNGWWRIRFDG